MQIDYSNYRLPIEDPGTDIFYWISPGLSDYRLFCQFNPSKLPFVWFVGNLAKEPLGDSEVGHEHATESGSSSIDDSFYCSACGTLMYSRAKEAESPYPFD